MIKKIILHLANAINQYDRNLSHQLRRKSVNDSIEYIEKNINYNFIMVNEKLDVFPLVPQRIKHGIILEFGVYKGITINHISKLLPDRKIFGFDSFEGLPVDWECSKDSFVTDLPKVDKNVKLIKGWFDDTIPTFLEKNDNKIAFINIDCDVYESTKTVLDLLGDRITKDTLIYLDDYFVKLFWKNNVFKAWQEWINNNKLTFRYLAITGTGGVLVKLI